MQRKLRLRNREDFNRIYRHGRSFANSQFVVYWRKFPETEQFRLGISASGKLGGAVVRNRLRRMIKEIVRRNAHKLNEGHDLILIVRKPALSLSYWEMEKSILHVLRKAGLTKGSVPPEKSPKGRGAGGVSPKSKNGQPRAFLCL
ncbi:ribonuclease P protein component [Cohnella algarum]|nr:ribonuclease P protein component [Cohnella algarum]